MMTKEEARDIFKRCVNNPHILNVAFWKETNCDEAIDEEEYEKRLMDSIVDGIDTDKIINSINTLQYTNH